MLKERTYKNMVLIPGSEFSMGSEKESRLTSPGKKVMVDSFYMDIYPVTNKEYQKVISTWRFDPEKGNYPIVGLMYDEILEYCRLTGKRLPTEAEWEKAARGDRDRRFYPWGNNFNAIKCNCRSFFFLLKQKPTPVEAYPEGCSPYGCFDMSGNVLEWTATKVNQEQYVLKGGSCTSPSKKYLTISSRLISHKDWVNQNYGFMCCCAT